MKINNKVKEAMKRLIPNHKITERVVELPFVFEMLPEPLDEVDGIRSKNLKVLDIGSCESKLLLELDRLGFDAWGIDMRDYSANSNGVGNIIKYQKFRKCDARDMSIFPNNVFDICMAISTLEHIGLVTHYKTDIKIDKDGDKKAIREMIRVTKPGGMILVTLPYGLGHSNLMSWVRFYNKSRIDQLFIDNRLIIDKIKYSIRIGNKWSECDEKIASAVVSHPTYVNGNVCVMGHKN